MQKINELTIKRTEEAVCAWLDEMDLRMKKCGAEARAAIVILDAEIKEKEDAARRNNKK